MRSSPPPLAQLLMGCTSSSLYSREYRNCSLLLPSSDSEKGIGEEVVPRMEKIAQPLPSYAMYTCSNSAEIGIATLDLTSGPSGLISVTDSD